MNKWISIEDSQPESGALVDIWQGGIFNWRTVDVYYLEDNEGFGFYSTETFDGELGCVTHWMISEPPK